MYSIIHPLWWLIVDNCRSVSLRIMKKIFTTSFPHASPRKKVNIIIDSMRTKSSNGTQIKKEWICIVLKVLHRKMKFIFLNEVLHFSWAVIHVVPIISSSQGFEAGPPAAAFRCPRWDEKPWGRFPNSFSAHKRSTCFYRIPPHPLFGRGGGGGGGRVAWR